MLRKLELCVQTSVLLQVCAPTLHHPGFPQALEIIENLENHQKSSMHGNFKIMEFEKS